ncbi:MAG: energy transducer TonB [Verrucomicrobia bacterium]|nr:energy transducer TonB [Verrucomicrobiota bacterium]
MKTKTQPRPLRVAVRCLLPTALLLAFTGCVHSVGTPSSLEVASVAAEDLPNGWTAPRILRTVAPEFPVDLRRAGIEGEVMLVCRIDEKGAVRHVAVAGTPTSPLDEPAIQAVYQWQFAPGSRQGEPAAMNILVPIRFAFRDLPTQPRPPLRLVAAESHAPSAAR